VARKLSDTHKTEIVYDADGNPKIWRERYGIHAIEVYLPSEPKFLPRETLDRLVEAARAELALAGVQSDLEIIAAASDAASGFAALLAWGENIADRTFENSGIFEKGGTFEKGGGLLSRSLLAARFLIAMHDLQMPSPKLEGADRIEADLFSRFMRAVAFANAWHYWHLEVFGEHARAFGGLQRDESLAKGPTIRKTKKEIRRSVILRLDDDTETASYIADYRFKSINISLEAHGLKPFKEKPALRRELQRIRRERKQQPVQ
jgi:hypothetical protein